MRSYRGNRGLAFSAPGTDSSRLTPQYGQKFGAVFDLNPTSIPTWPSLLEHLRHFTQKFIARIAPPKSAKPTKNAGPGCRFSWPAATPKVTRYSQPQKAMAAAIRTRRLMTLRMVLSIQWR